MEEDLMERIKKIINVDFSEKILKKLDDHKDIEVIDFQIKPATNKGDNYTSDMFRVIAEYTRSDSDEKLKKTFIVKVEPMIEGERQDLIGQLNLFSIEMMMMMNTLVKMNELLGDVNTVLNGRGLLTQKAKPSFLVIEDLATLGFRMADRQAGLDMDHCLLAIRGLARFHASSVALCEKEPEQKKLYTRGMFSNDYPAAMHIFFIEGTKQLGREVANWPELDTKYSEKILKLADVIYQKGIEASVRRDDEFNVINHGDFWVNNMLFKYDDDNKPIRHIFVDFQMCSYTSPAIDLLYFFNTSITDDMLVKNEDNLLNEYVQTLSSTMSKMGCKTKPPTVNDIKKMMSERAAFAMIASFSVLPIMLVDKNEAKDLGEIMNSGDYDNPAYRGRLYRKAMLNRLPKFNKMGLLD